MVMLEKRDPLVTRVTLVNQAPLAKWANRVRPVLQVIRVLRATKEQRVIEATVTSPVPLNTRDRHKLLVKMENKVTSGLRENRGLKDLLAKIA